MRFSWLTLLLLLTAAAVTLVAGSHLARREVQERIPVDRAKFTEFGDLLQTELERLESVYEKDLIEVALVVDETDPLATRRACESLAGVRECSFLPIPMEGDIKRITVGAQGQRLPGVAYRSKTLPIAPDAFVLDAKLIAAAKSPGSIPSGWIESSSGKYAAYWLRLSNSMAVVLTVDLEDVALRTNEHLVRWLAPHYGGIAASQINALQGPVSSRLAGTSEPPIYDPEYVRPLRTKLGIWQLLGWAKSSPKVIHDPVTLTVSGIGALLLCLLGFALFRQQRIAERLAQQRVSFVNRVSHELSSPLTNLSLNLDLASEWMASRPADARRRLGLVQEELQRLSRLVLNVLTFSRGERGKLTLTPAVCIPDKIIASSIEQFSPALTRAGIAVEYNAGARGAIRLDSDALAQIIGNLISNVEKYAGKGGVLIIRSELIEGMLRVHVMDRGPGIAARYRKLVFKPFERICERVNEGISGTGLGLAIARELAGRMGGRLILEESEIGAVFLLEVPATVVMESMDRSAA